MTHKPPPPPEVKRVPIPLAEARKAMYAAPTSTSRTPRKKTPQPPTRDLIVRGVCSGQYLPVRAEAAASLQAAEQIACIYATLHGRFTGRPPFDWQRDLATTPSKLGMACRAAIQAAFLRADFDAYVEAQFYWIADRFQRPPYWCEIANNGALLRYNLWQKMRDTGDRPAFQVHPAVLTLDPAKEMDAAHRRRMLDYEFHILERMIVRWGSEREVWLMFGDPADTEVFSAQFKRERPIWRTIYLQEQAHEE